MEPTTSQVESAIVLQFSHIYTYFYNPGKVYFEQCIGVTLITHVRNIRKKK